MSEYGRRERPECEQKALERRQHSRNDSSAESLHRASVHIALGACGLSRKMLRERRLRKAERLQVRADRIVLGALRDVLRIDPDVVVRALRDASNVRGIIEEAVEVHELLHA